jgi:hypothetical protein
MKRKPTGMNHVAQKAKPHDVLARLVRRLDS